MPRDKDKRLSAPVIMDTINNNNNNESNLQNSRAGKESQDSGNKTPERSPSISEDNGEHCCDHEHLEYKVVNEVFDFDVDTLYKMIFTDHPFYRYFQECKKSTKLVIGNWSDPDTDGDKNRLVTYVIAINHSMGPKSAKTEEKQIHRSISKPGHCYVVDCECYTLGVPYGDNFYLLNRFCLSRVSDGRARLNITSRIVYLKKVWGLIKSFIEKNVKNGVKESYVLISNLLREEAEAQKLTRNNHVTTNNKHVTSKRRNSPKTGSRQNGYVCKKHIDQNGISNNTGTHDTHINNSTEDQDFSTHMALRRPPRLAAGPLHTDETTDYTASSGMLAKVIVILLVFVIILHAVLYYKLWTVEEQANALARSRENCRNIFRNSAKLSGFDRRNIVNEQEEIYKAEMENWKHVLSASAEIMANIQESLVQLQSHIENRGRPCMFHPEMSDIGPQEDTIH